MNPASADMPANLNGDSFYSAEGNALFHCVPKVASRSLLKLCHETFADGFCIKEKGLTKPAFYATLNQTPFSFAFVRHPIERAVSFYFDKCVNYDGSEGKKQMFSRYSELKPSMTIKEFIAWLGSHQGRDANADHHFCSQHLFVYSRTWKKCVNFIGYFHTLDQDTAEVWKRLGHPLPELAHLNSNADPNRAKAINTSKDYRQYLDAADMRALHKRYQADFDLFDFEPQPQDFGARVGRAVRAFKRNSGLANIKGR